METRDPGYQTDGTHSALHAGRYYCASVCVCTRTNTQTAQKHAGDRVKSDDVAFLKPVSTLLSFLFVLYQTIHKGLFHVSLLC